MSVYTRVSNAQLNTFLHRYRIGSLVDYQGISAGITNTNYALTADSGNYILTLFEQIGQQEVEYILGLQHHLSGKGVRCATPVPDRSALFVSELNNRPAAIVHRVPGSICNHPSVVQCGLIGTELAHLHRAGNDYNPRRSNPRGLEWCQSMQNKLDPVLDNTDKRLLLDEINLYRALPLTSLPSGAIHADLFHDNVLFDGDAIGGIIDFDYACHDILVFDLGITINDWCIRENGDLDQEKIDALLKAYGRIRPLQDDELKSLPSILRFTALRFWLSRLYDKAYPVAGELTFVKDPAEFRNRLLQHRNQTLCCG